MHLYKHLKYRGAKPRGEVAKPKTELAHRGRLINVASDLYIHLHIYIYTHIYSYTWLHRPTYTYIYLHLLTYTYIYLHMRTNPYIYFICINIHTYIYIYLHVLTYTYIYLHVPTYTYMLICFALLLCFAVCCGVFLLFSTLYRYMYVLRRFPFIAKTGFRILLLVATRSTFLVLKVSAFEVPFGLHLGPF